jgi:hypothetical protein
LIFQEEIQNIETTSSCSKLLCNSQSTQSLRHSKTRTSLFVPLAHLRQGQSNQQVPQTVLKPIAKSFGVPVHTLASDASTPSSLHTRISTSPPSLIAPPSTAPAIYTGRSQRPGPLGSTAPHKASQPRTQVRKQLRHPALQPQAAHSLRKRELSCKVRCSAIHLATQLGQAQKIV